MNRKYSQAIADLVAAYEATTQSGSNKFLDPQAYHELINYYEEDEQLDRALEVADLAIAHHQFSAEFYTRKAHLLLEVQQELQALETLGIATIYAPNSLEIKILESEALTYLDRTQEAMELLENSKFDLSRSSAEMSEILLAESLIYQHKEEYELMYFILESALKENPKNREALDRVWLAVELSKQYENSVKLHEWVIDQDPYSALAWYNLGHTNAYLGNYEAAIEAYEYAFIIDNKFEYAYRDFSDLCFEMKKYKRALDGYLEMIEHFEAESESLLRIGQCYKELGNLDEAWAFFLKALQLDTLNDEVYFHLGTCYSAQGCYKEALKAFQKAINIEDLQEDYYVALGETYYYLDKFNAAKASFKKAITLAPEQTHCWIKYCRFLLKIDHGEEALALMEEAIDQSYDTSLVYGQIACLFYLGREQEAKYRLGDALVDDFVSHDTLFTIYPPLAEEEAVHSQVKVYLGM